MLRRIGLYHIKDGVRIDGPHSDLRGDCSGLWGNCSGLRGDCTGLRGYCTELRGDCTELEGDVTRLCGDCTGLEGDCSNIWGDCSSLWGDCSRLSGDIKKCGLKSNPDREGIKIMKGRRRKMNTPETKAAYIMTQMSCALIEALGMYTENQHREAQGQAIAYADDAFKQLIEKYSIDHNSVVSFLT